VPANSNALQIERGSDGQVDGRGGQVFHDVSKARLRSHRSIARASATQRWVQHIADSVERRRPVIRALLASRRMRMREYRRPDIAGSNWRLTVL
jgi:hypothetical protein